MAVTVENSGTQAASISTEHSLHSDTDAKVFQSIVDLTNMVDDDVVEIRVYVKAASGGTKRLAFFASFKHDQGDAHCVTPPIASPYYYELTLKQTAGTGRNFDWIVLSV